MVDLTDLFADNCGIERSRDMLTRLYRTVLFDLRLRCSQWETKLNLYVDQLAIDKPGFDKSSERGNVTKAMLKHTLTWPYLITMIKILGPEKAKFTLSMRWKQSPFHEHAKWGNEPFVEKFKAEVDLFSPEAIDFLTQAVNDALVAQRIDALKWNDLATLLVEEKKARYKGTNAMYLSSHKGNTVRIIGKEQTTTWKNFINVAETLRPSSIRIRVELTWRNDITTTHSLGFAVGSSSLGGVK